MPLRDYLCPNCNHVKRDVLRYSHEAYIMRCPECGNDMNAMIGSFEPVFLGEGWETNDHKEKKDDGDP